ACLPPFFTDAWQALDAIIEALPSSEQPLWRECRATLRQIAEKIETTVDTLEPGSLRDLLEEARRAVDVVLGRYGAVVPHSEDVLVADRTAPFHFSMSRDLVNLIEENLRLYWSFDRYGLGEIETRITIDHFFGAFPGRARVPLDEFLRRGAETDPAQRAWSWQERVLSKASSEYGRQAKEAFARWERELEPAAENPVHRLTTEETSGSTSALP